MKSRVFHILSFVILATLVFPPGLGSGVGTAQEVKNRSALDLPDVLQNGTTSCISLASDGSQGNGLSGNQSISADGRTWCMSPGLATW